MRITFEAEEVGGDISLSGFFLDQISFHEIYFKIKCRKYYYKRNVLLNSNPSDSLGYKAVLIPTRTLSK